MIWAGDRCESVNARSLNRCRKVTGHAGEHVWWRGFGVPFERRYQSWQPIEGER